MRTEAEDRYGNEFDWSPRTKIDAHNIVIRQGAETTVVQATGRYNNADVYVAADTTWTSPLLGGPVLFNLYALVDNGTYPILTGINPTLLPSFTTSGNQWRAYIAGVRGRVCDGFRLTATLGPAALVQGIYPTPSTAVMYAWGEETAPGTTIETGGGVDVRITSPLPLPVTWTDTLTVRERLSGAPADLVGTAPDGSGAGTATAIVGVSTPTVQGVLLSADDANALGSIVYVGYAALGRALLSIELGPGDSVLVPVDNAQKVFVLGSAAGLKWRASVLA